MSDAAPPSLPPPPQPARTGETPAPLRPGEQLLKIIATDAELQAQRQTIRLEGVVREISKDGTTATIETEKGEIEVQLRPRTVLEPGQKVQIDLPAGHPPRQLILRPAPDAPVQQSANPQNPAPPPVTQTMPAPGTSRPDATGETAARPATTPAEPHPSAPPPRITPQPALPPVMREMLDALIPPSETSLRPAVLRPDAIIRLVPLSTLPPDAQLQAAQAVNVPSRLPALPAQGATVRLPPNTLPVAGDLTLHSNALTNTALTGTLPAPVENTPLLPLESSPAAPVLQGKMDAAPGFSAQSIHLPLQQQIFPFIIPVADHPVPLPPGPVDMRVIAITPNGMPSSAPAAPTGNPTPGDHASPLTIRGNVIATTMQHFPVLSLTWPGNEAPDSFLLQFPASNLPIGTQIELQPYAGAPMMAATPLSTLPTPAAALMQGWDWPVFDEAVQVLNPAMPAAQALTRMIPNPATPAQIPPAMLFFMAAVGAGDLSGWLGEKAVNALRREGSKGADILGRLNRDFAGLSRLADDPALSQDWKGMAIPMMGQNEISKIHLFYRHQDAEKEEAEDKDGRSTRFLFDFNLSRIGDVQLDGYMKAKRLDLIVRTKTLFSAPMQNHMRQVYRKVLEQGQLTGDLGFQNRADQWVHVDMRQSALKTSV